MGKDCFTERYARGEIGGNGEMGEEPSRAITPRILKDDDGETRGRGEYCLLGHWSMF